MTEDDVIGVVLLVAVVILVWVLAGITYQIWPERRLILDMFKELFLFRRQ